MIRTLFWGLAFLLPAAATNRLLKPLAPGTVLLRTTIPRR